MRKSLSMTKSNMYRDSVFQWNCFVGCKKHNCVYCKRSFKAQMRRQIHNCEKCGNYIPHVHEERLTGKYINDNFSLLETNEDQFIWVGSSGDISFIEPKYMKRILEVISYYPEFNFFFQTKDPKWFQNWDFPDNVILAITLESNIHYPEISKAIPPWKRAAEFYPVCHKRKRVTIEPIMDFDHTKFFAWIRDINPEIVYIGYNSKDSKSCHLPEPSLAKTELFIADLRKITRVKEKLMRKAWDEK